MEHLVLLPPSNPCKSPELQPTTIYRMPDFCLNKPQHQAKAKEPSPSRTPWNHGTAAGTEGEPGATSSEEPCAGTSKTPTLIVPAESSKTLKMDSTFAPLTVFQLALLPMFKTCRISGALAASWAAETWQARRGTSHWLEKLHIKTSWASNISI